MSLVLSLPTESEYSFLCLLQDQPNSGPDKAPGGKGPKSPASGKAKASLRGVAAAAASVGKKFATKAPSTKTTGYSESAGIGTDMGPPAAKKARVSLATKAQRDQDSDDSHQDPTYDPIRAARERRKKREDAVIQSAARGVRKLGDELVVS